MAASSGDQTASGGDVGCASGEESACSTPFVSAPSSPARDPSFSAAGCFYSAPASPARGGPGTADEYDGCELGFDFDFSRCPSPAAAAMSSADELFHNGQIRPMRLTSFLLRPQALPSLDGDVPPPPQPPPSEQPPPHERGRLRRSPPVHRRYRSLSPFRARWLSPSSSPAPAAQSVEPAAAGEAEAAPSASRSSSSSSTASAASSSSSRSYYRRWGFLKDILHRSKSDGGERPPLPSNPSPPLPPAAPKRNPSPSASRGRGRARRSAHARLYEARRAEAEEMRRRTFLPYRQGGLLLGCLGLGSLGFGAMHGLAAAAAAGKARP
ncbi:uncharacterized protein [Miscanthus floridulus]|uniref:uncharacterized protein n=1 Tax=Miscanthus floridulus TaxID=154761 RepID=UPI003459D176